MRRIILCSSIGAKDRIIPLRLIHNKSDQDLICFAACRPGSGHPGDRVGDRVRDHACSRGDDHGRDRGHGRDDDRPHARGHARHAYTDPRDAASRR